MLRPCVETHAEPTNGQGRAVGRDHHQARPFMQTAHDHGTTFEALSPGQPFRFYYRGEVTIGIKAQFSYGSRGEAALVLTSTKAGLQSGDLLSGDKMGNVVELAGAKIIPSLKPATATPGVNHFAEPGEIELRQGGLIFVTKPQAGAILRVDIQTGAIGTASGAVPAESYSEWSVIRDGAETLYEHKPSPPDPTESATIT
jgi:hypothetical protein